MSVFVSEAELNFWMYNRKHKYDKTFYDRPIDNPIKKQSTFGERLALLTPKEQDWMINTAPNDRWDYEVERDLFPEHGDSILPDDEWVIRTKMMISDAIYYEKIKKYNLI